jgi:hypothetical protein
VNPRTAAPVKIAIGAAMAACFLLSSCSISARFGRGIDSSPGAVQNPGEGVNLSAQGAINLFTGAFLFDWFTATFLAGGRERVPPPPATMAEDRVVNEQDCTRPIEKPQANLRCR